MENGNEVFYTKFKNLLNEKLTEDEKKIYNKNFELYLINDDDTKFIVNFDDIYKWSGFTRKDNAKKLLTNKFIIDKDYIINKEISTLRGKYNNEIIMLNVSTFKCFCIINETEKGKLFQMYYLKLEKIFNECNKIYLNESLEQINDLKKQLNETNYQKHHTLINAHQRKRLVYIMKLQTFANNSFIIKIGETMDIKERVQDINKIFNLSVEVLYCFPCEQNYEFEQFLHKHKKLLACKYTEVINNTTKSNEVYLIKSEEMFNTIVRLAQKNVKYFISNNIKLINAQKELEIIKQRNIILDSIKDDKQLLLETREKYAEEDLTLIKFLSKYNFDKNLLIDIINKMNNIVIHSNNKHIIINSLDKQNTKEIIIDSNVNESINLEKIILPNNSTNNNSTNIDNNEVTSFTNPKFSQGPLVQIYSGKDIHKLIKIYDSITEATRNIPSASYTQIKKASQQKTIYLGYRWFLIPRNDSNPDKVKDIGETVDVREKKVGYIAMINLNKTKIINVFSNQKLASDYISQHPSALSTAIKYNTPLSGYHWFQWNNLDDEIKDKYLENNTLPVNEIINQKGTTIERIDPDTNSVIETLSSITEVCKKYKISPKTIKKAITNHDILNGFFWQIKI